MTEKAANTAGLSAEEKRSLLARLLKTKGREHRPFSLSFAQQRMWFMEQLEPGTSAYSIRLGFRLEGRLDKAALQDGLNEMVRRHESLRTVFSAVGGQPVQIILPAQAMHVSEVDLRTLPLARKESAAEELAAQEARRPFDLRRGPLCRVRLLRLDEDTHHLLLTMHHIVSDGWSMELFYGELTALYEAFNGGRPSPLAEPSIQYADYAQWQRGWLQGEVLDEHLGYWKRQLAGAPALLELPSDRPRPAAQSYRGKRQTLRLSRGAAEGLREFGAREGATMFMALAAAFKALLHRYSGQTDVVVGTPVANRSRAEVEGVIGPLVNTLVLRADLGGDPSYRELLRRVKAVALGAYSHQDMPFDVLLEHLNVKRDLSFNPVFQVMFSIHTPPANTLKLSGVAAERIRINAETTKFDLNLTITDGAQGTWASLEYNTDLYEDGSAERMLRHFEALLAGASADPDRPLSELPLLGDAERREMLAAWNDTARDYGKGVCVHSMFEEQARRTPDRVAVAFGGEQLTYAELDGRADAVAARLLREGLLPEDKVAICLERSAEMVAAVLGVLKAGGAYIPLDPAYPSQRIAFMLEDSRAAVLLTQDSLLGMLPEHGAKVLCMDSHLEAAAGIGQQGAAPQLSPDNLAYVLYTSGSTGAPKGVQVPHGAVVNFINSMRELTAVGESDALLAVTTLSFDIAGLELFLPLSVGARLEVASRDEAADGERLAARMSESGVTVMQATPATWRMLLQSGWQGDAGLQILCGGEALPQELATELTAAGRRVLNLYGPTETTIWSSAERVGGGPVTIGRPIANTQFYILDGRFEPVPAGVAGDIYIAGEGVTRGYLNQGEKTAERFIPAAHGVVAGARMYKTGDRGRYCADGRIKYEGRDDHQVKVRGYRIELGEIEAALNQFGAVSEGVAAVREDEAGEKRLVAYVVCEQGAAPRVGELREHLKQRLPDYMVPSRFVFMQSLPLTPNGKIDRRALPAPDDADSEREGIYVAPRTAVEEIVAGIWSEVLKVERVGAEDDFFELGGHSLLATQVVSRVRQAFQVEIPLRSLFESPTVAAFAARVEAEGTRDEGLAVPPIKPAPRDRDLPTSFSQTREWFLQRLESETYTYNIPAAVGLKGDLVIEALRQGVNEIIRRHESLRTNFVEVEGQPVQVIRPGLTINIPLVDLTGLSEFAREAETRRLAKAEAQHPFDLAADPLVRATLLRTAADNHVVLLTMHHIVSDGWSRGVFVRELDALYSAFAAGQNSPLAEPSIQYADFACWQRQWLDGGPVLEAQLAYWKQQLQAAPAVLELPTDRPRPPFKTYRGATETIEMGAELSRGLRELSRKQAVSLYMTLLSAFDVLLARYSNQTDILVGTYIANRNRQELEGLIGFFVNTLVIRADLSGNPTFRELLARVRKVTVEAFAHQDVPFEKLLESMQVERARSHTPLFQTMLVHQNAPEGRLRLPGLDSTPLNSERGRANFDLTLVILENGGELQGLLEYNTDLFDRATAARMLRHFRNVLEAVAADPELRVQNLPLIAEPERRQLLVEWNGAKVARADAACAHELFEAQAGSRPDAVAVEHESERVTYAELNRRANRLAHYLRRKGVGPDVVVGVCLERSVEMIVGILGVLKAGGAYVALDPAYPAARIAYMAKDSRTPVVITSREFAPVLDEQGLSRVCLDAERELIARESGENPAPAATADNLAYVIYTSGSTGKPKGVMVQHSSLVGYTETAAAQYGVESQDRVLQFASINFDASAEEIYPCLARGAALVLRNDAMLASAAAFLEECAARALSVLDLPTAYWHELAEEMSAEGLELPASVRLVIIGGEKALAERLRAWQAVAGEGVRLVNTYGPTETTVVATKWEQTPGEAQPADVPIGRAIDNARVYVLDEIQQPVPVGVHGELHIGGAGTTRGYLRRPELTAEKFTPDPFGTEPGARLYRSGDLVRYLGDGNLEYAGRIDHQVKVRGFRIELGEIEEALLQHVGIKEAAALIVENAPGEKRLTAFLVINQDTAFSVSELRNELKKQLPDYMLPTAFVKLDSLPVTVSGKIDRRALSYLEGAKLEAGEEFVAPRTAVEELLAGIWSDLLGAEEVGAEDNFFDLGGHSLLATQVVSRIRQAFGVEVPLRSLFDSPTVAGLAEEIEAAMTSASSEGEAVPQIEPAGRDGLLPLSSAQERLWFLDSLTPGSSAYNIPWAMRLTGRLGVAALEQAVGEIVRRHEVLRTSFEEREGRPAQVIGEGRNFGLAFVGFDGMSKAVREREVRRLASAEAARPFDLKAGPVIRARLLRLAESEHVLLLTVHHIASDGWSMGVLVRELVQLYEALARGEASPLEELRVQYADYAQWQRRMLEGEALEGQLGYWRKKLGGETPVLELPTDRPRPAVLSDRGATQSVAVSKRTSEALKRLSRGEGATLFMTLTAAFKVLLSRYSGQSDIVVGTPIAGRNRAETEGLIGFFINMLVLRTDLSGDPTFKQLMAREREAALEGHLNQDVPFERLVEELQPGRDMSRTPLFQVMFALQNTRKEGLRLPGLKMSPVGAEIKTVHFELSVALAEGEQGLRGAVEYSTDLFDGETVRRMVGHFVNLLDAIAEDADRKLSELPMLGEADRRQLLVEWNDTASERGRGVCVQALVEGHARRAPDSLAVAFGDEQITYGELNARANRLAHYLRRRGVGPEVIVGVCTRRGVEMVVALLGVLKAGGAYAPLDPAYPERRLRYMLEDARAEVLVGEAELVAPIAEGTDACALTVIELDARRAEIASESAEDFPFEATEQNLAYVIYTSGSTGVPKGIGVSHEGLSNLVNWHQRRFDVGAADRATQMAGMSFDASVWELWPYLGAGASIHVVDDETRASASKLRDWLVVSGITKTFLPTPLAEAVLTLEWPERVALRMMLTGGDKLHRHPPARLPFELVNNYGPSESSVVSTSGTVAVNTSGEEAPSIGRPIDNTRVYIVNANGLAPVRAAGELFVGSRGLARCYLNHPELTAERFVPDAYGPEAGARLYRTGDLGRYKAGGEIEYVGRVDDQVKIRGYRIELREIETILSQHEAVADSAVVVREAAGGDRRLVAYVACEQGSGPRVGELKEHLKQRLPDYMVPAAFVLMDSLPLTPNGKVDRRALPAPDASDAGREGEYVAPRNAVEEIVAGIWSEVLKTERVGVEDNFFDLGGHSLLATQVVSRVRQAFGVEVSLRSLFESPTVAGLAGVVETAMISAEAEAVPPIEPVSRDRRLQLSSAQERLWFIENLRPGSSAYNVPSAMRLKGRLDVAALEQSLGEIVRRHEVLRTRFRVELGRPVQVIGASEGLRLAVVELGPADGERTEREVRRLASAEAARPFDLTGEAMLRARLLRLADAEHVLLLTVHHIASDGWSMGVLVREMMQLYAAFAGGEASALEELRIQYADFAQWQRRMFEGEALKQQLGYWREKLGGELQALELPTDKVRPAVLSDRGARHPVSVSKETCEGLKALSRGEGATLFMTLTAAFKVLLSQYSGQSDIVVGTPIAGRNRAETENLIGFFVNTLALRTDLSGDPSFSQLIAREREVALGAYLNQDVPFERLVEELQPGRDMSRTPLFQVMFALQNAPQQSTGLAGLEISPVRMDVGTAHFELSLSLAEGEQGLKGVLEYSTDLYERETVRRMVGHFVNLLDAVVQDAGRRVSELPLMSEEERHQVLVEWNDTAKEYAAPGWIHELFESQAQASPDRAALVYEGRHVSYGELNARANRLARRLRSLGVGPEVVVGVFMERSVEMVVALLGILKAGGAYLPLDPDHPQQRLLSVMEESEAPVVLTQQRLLAKLPRNGAHALSLDSQWDEVEAESADALPSLVTGDNLAYVIYTSGSTGRPKGAMLPHAGILNRLLWMQEAYRLTERDVVVQKTPFGFDVSVWEFFWPLMEGARLVVARPGGHKDSAYLAGLMEEEKVSVAHFVPSMLQAMLQAGGLERCGALRQVVCSGEALGHELQERFFEAAGPNGTRLDNLYGPTEASVDVTWWACEAGGGSRVVPIGRPIANTSMYVLGSGGGAVPAGVSGELHIGGVGLGRGYLGRPDLTAERFVPCAYGAGGGERLYRTGDVARYLRDGNIEYIGRMDAQVKIRGNRVELGEIEAALREHPHVEEAAVVVRGEGAADKELVGYVVGREGGPKAGELRGYLKERIPVYMIPSALVSLKSLPLLSNGKVDRGALRSLERPRPESEAAYVAPRTGLEQTITNIWSKALNLKKFGVNDNFFDLGGSSLTLIQVCYELRESLDVEISVIELFEYPTIGELASHLGNKNGREHIIRQVQDRASKQKEAMKRQRRIRQEV